MFGNLTPVAAIVFDCADPDAIAPSWSDATGWPALGRDDEGVWLSDVMSSGPVSRPASRPVPDDPPLRVRIDVASSAA